MIAGCYALDLYCDNSGPWPDGRHKYNEFPHQYTDELGSRCRQAARRDGWLLTRDGKAYCPKCSKKMRAELGEKT